MLYRKKIIDKHIPAELSRFIRRYATYTLSFAIYIEAQFWLSRVILSWMASVGWVDGWIYLALKTKLNSQLSLSWGWGWAWQ